ncbi:MAG: hypothetical protein AB7P16_24980 [Bradyrhizobium sp.]|uniref:hypothetical protein n=1 Tax=Bradyrhizobium sp. TaxID=376 RepID=UPI003D0B50A2
MPLHLDCDDHRPIFPEDHGREERQSLLRDVEGATWPDRAAIFLGRLIFGLFIALALLTVWVRSQGAA